MKSIKASILKTQQKIKNRVSIDSSKSKYLVVVDVDYINKNIRVEMLLTNAKEYKSIKLSIKSIEKFRFNNNKFNSRSRIYFSINQIAETSQYQHIAIKKNKLFISFKSVVFINAFNSTLSFSLSIIHEISQILISISSRIDFLRALIHQMIYVSINSRFRLFKQ